MFGNREVHRKLSGTGGYAAGRLAAVHFVHVCHDTGVAFPVAFDRVDVSVPVLPERNPHPPEFPDDEPGYLPLLTGDRKSVV